MQVQTPAEAIFVFVTFGAHVWDLDILWQLREIVSKLHPTGVGTRLEE